MNRVILLYTHAFAGGGAEVVFSRLAASIAEGGDHVIFAADHAIDGIVPPDRPRLRHVLFGHGHRRDVLALAALLRAERPTASFSALGAQNVKHCAAATLAGRRDRCVLGYHGFAAAEPRLLARSSFRAAPLLTRLAARTVCVSDALLQDLHTRWHADRSRLLRIHNPVLPVDPAKREAGGGPPLVVACGRMVPIKRFPLMVEAFASVRPSEARLAILGDGPDRPAVERAIAATGQAGRVEVVGAVADPADWYARADCLAIASDSESFGLTAAEALSHGVPVVTTDCGGPGEILVAGCGLVVPRDDARALADGLTAVLADPGDPGPRLARARDFALTTIRDRYLALADTLARG